MSEFRYSPPVVQLVLRPGLIDLGWGHPASALLPADLIREATNAVFVTRSQEALAYGYATGPGPLLEWLQSQIYLNEGRKPELEQVLVTGGNSWAIDQICTTFAKPGDCVLVEAPTYHLAVRILRDHPVELIPVFTDEDGIDIEQLSDRVRQLKLSGRTVRMLYCVPTYNNPTGRSLEAARRRQLVDLAGHEGFLIIEDDVYRELSFDGPAPVSLWSLDTHDIVIRLGSFSKTLAPGLRVGFLTAPADVCRALGENGLLDSGGGVAPISGLIVNEICRAGGYRANLGLIVDAYRRRRDALLNGLEPLRDRGCHVRPPHGGFFVWVTLPEVKNAMRVLERAEERGMSFLPGNKFFVGGGGDHALRLAFSFYAPEELVRAARMLVDAIDVS